MLHVCASHDKGGGSKYEILNDGEMEMFRGNGDICSGDSACSNYSCFEAESSKPELLEVLEQRVGAAAKSQASMVANWGQKRHNWRSRSSSGVKKNQLQAWIRYKDKDEFKRGAKATVVWRCKKHKKGNINAKKNFALETESAPNLHGVLFANSWPKSFLYIVL